MYHPVTQKKAICTEQYDYALEIKDNPLIRPGSLNIVAKHIGDKIIQQTVPANKDSHSK